MDLKNILMFQEKKKTRIEGHCDRKRSTAVLRFQSFPVTSKTVMGDFLAGVLVFLVCSSVRA